MREGGDGSRSQLPAPHDVQIEALAALEATRAAGNQAGLVVLATGLGKTWLSAFDTNRPEYCRILFVAHREEILGQARETYRQIRPKAKLGLYTGTEKSGNADILFASIQTLGKRRHLEKFAPKEFQYIVVDEFHHASAPTYRQLIDHFTPKFLLALTATPERTDGGDLLALCQENLVYRCDVIEGIRRGLLCPYRYFGVPDEVDYRNIPWRSSRFDESALTTAVATESRARNILDQYRMRAGERTIAFCCSQRHADFMATFFAQHGVRAVAVHAGPTSRGRVESLTELAAGNLDVICAVDMFNEGLDIPQVDTVMMLRPTESRIVWLQQFGRGLRTANGKDFLTVIDYVGNHRAFLLKVRALFDLGSGYDELARVLNQITCDRITLPPGCEVTYDLVALDILNSLLPPQVAAAAMADMYYGEFKEQHDRRPSAVEVLHDGYNPRMMGQGSGTWLAFLEGKGDLSPTQQRLLRQFGGFLNALETTPMTRSFKMLTLQAMLQRDVLPGRIEIGELCTEFSRLAARSTVLRGDVGVPLEDHDQLRKYLEKNPIAAWTEGKGTGGDTYFAYDGCVLGTAFNVADEDRSEFQELVREIVDWRLAQYLQRKKDTGVLVQP
jgi:superfamily II DNA or RNA helicase